MKQTALLFSFLFFVAFLFSACEDNNDDNTPDDQPTAPRWQVELVDSIAGSDVGEFNMLALDADSGIHIAYIVDDSQLKYAYKPYNGTNWTLKIVAENLDSEMIDIATDSQNRIYIAYENSDGKLMIAEKNLTDANFTHLLVIDNHLPRYPALFCDQNNNLHIAYQKANYGMRYAVHTFGQNFIIETVGNDNDILGSRPAVVTKTDGSVHILWHDNDDIKYAEKTATATEFTVQTIATGKYSASYEDVGLKKDRYEKLHGYFLNGQQDNNLIYIYKDAQWTTQGIGNSRAERIDHAIATDTLAHPHIVFSSTALEIAGKNSSWSFESIAGNDDYRCGDNTDIEITDQNAAHVSFYVSTTDVLKYAYRRLD